VDGVRRKRIVGLTAVGAIVVGVLAYAVFAVVSHDDQKNPYRDGTTHAVTLRNGSKVINGLPECSNSWTVHVGGYTWEAEGVPRSWGAAPVRGKLHIIDSQDPAALFGKGPNGGPGATFTARGVTLNLSGGRIGDQTGDQEHWGFALTCEGYRGGYTAGRG
jgi:hypothetical protein